MDIDSLLGRRVRALRDARNLTLAELADLSGVSRSTISLIERGETSPTAAILNKLADALGVALPALFADAADAKPKSPLARRADQTAWTDPDSGYVRRQLTPAGFPAPFDLVEVEFPPGARVAFENPTQRAAIHQQAWILDGAMEIAVGGKTWRLAAGDCLAMELGARIVFRNPTRRKARYVLALAASGRPQ